MALLALAYSLIFLMTLVLKWHTGKVSVIISEAIGKPMLDLWFS